MVSAIRFCGDNKRFSLCVRALRFQGRRRRLLVSCVAPPTDHSRDITISPPRFVVISVGSSAHSAAIMSRFWGISSTPKYGTGIQSFVC